MTGVLVRFPNGHEAVIPFLPRRRGKCAAPGCDRDLIGRRPQTRYCGTRCRVAAHRARQAGAAAAKPLQAPPADEKTRLAAVTVSEHARSVGATVPWTELVAAELGEGWPA